MKYACRVEVFNGVLRTLLWFDRVPLDYGCRRGLSLRTTDPTPWQVFSADSQGNNYILSQVLAHINTILSTLFLGPLDPDGWLEENSTLAVPQGS